MSRTLFDQYCLARSDRAIIQLMQYRFANTAMESPSYSCPLSSFFVFVDCFSIVPFHKFRFHDLAFSVRLKRAQSIKRGLALNGLAVISYGRLVGSKGDLVDLC